jgi:hypothetical protein
VCFCSLSYPVCKAHVVCRHLWPVRLYNVFPLFLINVTIFEKKKVIENEMSYYSSSIGTTTLSWVSACSTVVEHSQQEGFTECRCQRHVKIPTWRRTSDLERSNFRHKRSPASEATLANPAAEGGTMGDKWPREFCRK